MHLRQLQGDAVDHLCLVPDAVAIPDLHETLFLKQARRTTPDA
jgi:hypothetical protein